MIKELFKVLVGMAILILGLTPIMLVSYFIGPELGVFPLFILLLAYLIGDGVLS